MAIDLNALANINNNRLRQKELNTQKATKALTDWHNKEEQKELSAIAQESNDIVNLAKGLNYNSDVSDFNNVQTKNEEWLVVANNNATTAADKKVNQAIYESKNTLIGEKRKDALIYAGLENKIDSKWNEIKSLQTSDENYDFTEVEKALEDYKKIGENILNFNSQWVHGANYKANVTDIENWIDLGQEFQTLDIDPETEGIQTSERFPSYDAILNRGYKSWALGNTDNAQRAMNKSLDYLTGSYEAKQQAEVVTQEQIEEYTISYMENIPEGKMNNIIDYSKDVKEYNARIANGDTEAVKPEVPVSFNREEEMVAQGLITNNPTYTDQLNLNEQTYTNNKETSAYASINSVKNALGKGSGQAGLNIDPSLRNALIGIGTYTTAEGKLSSLGARKSAVKDITANIKNIFKYLESGVQRLNPFGDDFYDNSGEVERVLSGAIVEGSPEWYQAMDSILNDYLPFDEFSGVRKENSDAVSATVTEFGGNNQQERNGYELLMRYLKAYESIRILDREFGEDPANILNIRTEN